MKKAVEYMKKYINSYDGQFGYMDYSDEIFIQDMLYGIRVSLGEEYEMASGFDRFKKRLRKDFV